jgi:hypothetical protein
MSRARNLSDVGGISYITATGNKVGIGSTIPQYTLDVNGNVSFSGTLYQGGSVFASGIGIQSAGTSIGTGVTTLNFIGAGNTFAINGGIVDISITGGGAASYASTAGIATVAQGLTGTPDITVNNIVAVAATFTGNVSIAGTLTYEDVTNVDSVGLVTARSGVQIGSPGIAATLSSNGSAVFSGIVTATTFSGQVNAGVGTVTTLSSTNATLTNINSSGVTTTTTLINTGLVGVNTTTVVGSASSQGAIQAVGNVSITDGVFMMDSNIDTNVTVPSGKNALMIGPITVGTGYTVLVESGSTLVVV